MSTFKLEDCPKVEGYWLAKTECGEMAIVVKVARDGIMSGVCGSDNAEWHADGRNLCGTLSSCSLVGPWSAADLVMPESCRQYGHWVPLGQKAIIGWTAEEMARAYLHAIKIYLVDFDGSVAAGMQSLIDNKPTEPIWCEHVKWNPLSKEWYEGGALTARKYFDPFCSKCGKPRPEGK